MKLGDSLFETQNTLQQFSEDMDPELIEQLIEKENPELTPMLEELHKCTMEIQEFLTPALQKIKKGGNEGQRELRKYLEMKKSLMTSYCTFMVFYLLLKIDGKDTSQHPVVFKLAHIRTLFDKLKSLDGKVNKTVTKLIGKPAQVVEREEDSWAGDHEDARLSSLDDSASSDSEHEVPSPASKPDLYKAQETKLRLKKAQRKEKEADMKAKEKVAVEKQTKAIQRNVERDIIVNKGLVRKRPKKDRTPRVRKRLKFEEAEKKRRHIVKEYNQGHKEVYRGEAAGLKQGVIRSHKI